MGKCSIIFFLMLLIPLSSAVVQIQPDPIVINVNTGGVDTNVTTFCSGTQVLLGNGSCLAIADIGSVADTNESARFGNLASGDCGAGNLVIGVQLNGTVLCAADSTGTGNESWNESRGNLLYALTVWGYNQTNTIFNYNMSDGNDGDLTNVAFLNQSHQVFTGNQNITTLTVLTLLDSFGGMDIHDDFNFLAIPNCDADNEKLETGATGGIACGVSVVYADAIWGYNQTGLEDTTYHYNQTNTIFNYNMSDGVGSGNESWNESRGNLLYLPFNTSSRIMNFYENGSNTILNMTSIGGINSFGINTAGSFFTMTANPSSANDDVMFQFSETQGADTDIVFYEGGTGNNRIWDSGSMRIGGGISSLCSNLTTDVDCNTPATGADLVVQDDIWAGGKIFSSDWSNVSITSIWHYNQTAAAGVYNYNQTGLEDTTYHYNQTNTIFNYNMSDGVGSGNESWNESRANLLYGLLVWSYNQTDTMFNYNQTNTIFNYNMSDGVGSGNESWNESRAFLLFQTNLTNEAGLYTALSDVTEFIETSDAATLTTLDTGFGANELYDMNQHVLTTSSPEFAQLNASIGVLFNGDGLGLMSQDGNNVFTASTNAGSVSLIEMKDVEVVVTSDLITLTANAVDITQNLNMTTGNITSTDCIVFISGGQICSG